MGNQNDGWVKRRVNGVALFALIPACLAFLLGQADPLRVAALGFCLYVVLGALWAVVLGALGAATERATLPYVLAAGLFILGCLAVYVCAFGAFSPFI